MALQSRNNDYFGSGTLRFLTIIFERVRVQPYDVNGRQILRSKMFFFHLERSKKLQNR